MSVAGYAESRRVRLGALAFVVLAVAAAVATVRFDFPLGEVFSEGTVARSVRQAAPITLAAIGGLYAEKSGVFNIGLEGFMIFGAFFAAAGALTIGGETALHAWSGILIATVLTTLLTVAFAILLIRYEADQIVAGLGVWFVALGLAPFAARVMWDQQRSDPVPEIGRVTVPGLNEVDYLGPVVFDQSPLVWLTVAIVLGSWVLLYRTKYGYWIQAAGENPEALDTAGVSVARVRYATVILSGALAGLGGAVLLAHSSSFNGTGATMVDGRGWLGIVAYLFGNYNPIGAAAAAFLFAGVDMVQGQLQTIGIDAPGRLMGLLPYVVVIVVLAGWGRTRVPSSVGESYDTEE